MKFFIIFISVLLNGVAVSRPDVKLIGELNQTITLPSNKLANSIPLNRDISLLKLKFSDTALETMSKRASFILANDNKTESCDGPRSIQLGMNNIPVLDQGSHATCATFANTAAIDAGLGQGDYISQLCLLQLGLTLESEKLAWTPSGWSGTLGPIVLKTIDTFGVVSKQNQKIYGCGGLKEYPTDGTGPTSGISLADYHENSDALRRIAGWSPILDIAEYTKVDKNITFQDVRNALVSGDRVTIGVALVDFELGTVGAVGKYKNENDTWVLTHEMLVDLYKQTASLAGHEMIVTGYDDDAVAYEYGDEKIRHQGLFKLRNSWGDKLGDGGDFYMSYDYFKTQVIEAQRIKIRKNY
ncbi:cysteine protease, papain C1 family (plasmid) [Legionella adelaidensis]|uniref:Cysteine protease n=1 Tax=Legionella adelaidensis TaxID=45056 RepID=A0A0W0R119_9GAMM|nr:C1 family peptidase [Legionella adelaidensis]KTC64774.1 cysteine protease [Legionella adelaidensis]VEH81905.1 cysteine protease, papain C1 family [Legionella adelaidensis]